nr:Smf1 [Starmerella bombicola]
MTWVERALRRRKSRPDLGVTSEVADTTRNSIGRVSEESAEHKDLAKKKVESTEASETNSPNDQEQKKTMMQIVLRVLKTFIWFVGPGVQVSVAYMDPGNYSTDVQGGAGFQYKMLFVILLSTIIALYLQILSIRLGSVTGRDLAQSCYDHLPKYISWFVWLLAEAAILSTDVAEVAGTAIALRILIKVPLIAGVFITIADVLLTMAVYGRESGMKALRFIEITCTILIMTVVVSFCVILTKIPATNVGHVLKGYIPSHEIISAQGITTAAGILGATVMPHSLYLGSAQTIPRVREYDLRDGYSPQERDEAIEDYRPSIFAIKSTIRYSTAELVLALVTIALFANSAILITAGDTLYGTPDSESADLFNLNDTLRKYLGNGVAILFFVALLASGLSAGVICTIAGQVVSEGHIQWKTKPWVRRLVTRVVTLIPCVIVVAALGQKGISDALNWSQVVLTITLPFLAIPLVYLTSCKKVMTVSVKRYDKDGLDEKFEESGKDCSNGWISKIFGGLVCLFICIVNVYLIVELGITGQP